MKQLPAEDLEHARIFSPDMRGARVLVNGVGWIGGWLMETLSACGAKVSSRMRGEPYPTTHFDIAIHAASSGIKPFLDFVETLDVPRSLYLSSGAIYHRDDDYAKAKRDDEKMCAEHGANPVIARCYAFVGPRQKLDAHWAVGNFLLDALAGRDITVNGDGSAVRSYMHMADLSAWLITLAAKGNAGKPYNVGSEEAVSIADLAGMVGAFSGSKVKIDGKPSGPDYYVPSTTSAHCLGLSAHIPLKEALNRTWAWLN